MFLERITISKMKGTMQMKMQKLVGVTTKKVRMIQIILMLKAMMHTHLKLKIDQVLNEGKSCKLSNRK